MSPDPIDQPREAAVEQLEAFGLTEYTARSFVALLALGTATAKEISEASGVPRTRVYDVMEVLEERGLVSVRHSEPKQFWAVSGETASRQFERRLMRRVNIFREAVGAIDTDTSSEEQRGVWTVSGRDSITARIVEFVEAASDEIVFMTVEPLLDEEITGALRAASERGVTVKLGEMADGAEGPIHDALSQFESVDSLWKFEDTPAGRLLLVDERQTLVSVLVPEPDVPVSRREETAIWGTGRNNSLVVVLRAMFTWQLGGDFSID
jgi:sugar-specific transcriptional regulator TrmB